MILESGLNIRSSEALASSKTMGQLFEGISDGMALMIRVVVGTKTFCKSKVGGRDSAEVLSSLDPRRFLLLSRSAIFLL